jgi:hypothetical protein
LTGTGAVLILNRGRKSAAALERPGDERVIGRAQRTVLAGVLLLAVTALGPVRAGTETGEAARLRLVVRHALDAGRLIVRIGEAAFYSAPLAPPGAVPVGEIERMLSIPSGLQTLSVELRDRRGKVIARSQVRGLLVPGAAAVLDVVASATGEKLSLELRAIP